MSEIIGSEITDIIFDDPLGPNGEKLKSNYILPDKEAIKIRRNMDCNWFFDLDLCNDDSFLAGGAFRKGYYPEQTIQDFDMIFSNQEAFDICLEKIKEQKFSIFEDNQKFANRTVTFNVPRRKEKIQLIGHYLEGPNEIVDYFDFTCCMFVYDGTYIHTTTKSVVDMKAKSVNIHRVNYPLATLGRMFKYKDYGFEVSKKTMLDYMIKIDKKKNLLLTKGKFSN